MKRFCRKSGILSIFLAVPIFAQWANHPVISEIRYDERSETNEEFVELYNPTLDTVYLEDWSLAYKSKTGTTWKNKETFTSEHKIPPYGFFLWGGDAVIPLPDVAETSQASMGLSNSGGHIALKNAEGDIVDLVAWEGAETPEGSGDAGKTDDGGSLERKASAESTSESMAQGGAEAFAGNGYDTDENSADFVIHPLEQVNPQNSESSPEPDPTKTFGAGSAALLPEWAFGGSVLDIQLQIESTPDDTIQKIGVISSWTVVDVTLEEAVFADAEITFSDDTLLITNFNLSGNEEMTLLFSSVEIPDTSCGIEWSVFTETEEAASGLKPIPSFPGFDVLPSPVPISNLHQNDAQGISLMSGDTVTVQGIVTVGTGTFSSAFTDVYMQDISGGIKLFDSDIHATFATGDSVTLRGIVHPFHGMTEITPIWNYVIIHSQNHDLPAPVSLTCEEVNNTFQADNTEPHESKLVRLENVMYNPTASTLTDATGTCGIYLDPDANLSMLTGKYHISGLLTQYKPGASDPGPPYFSDYSLQPRFQEDIEPASTLIFVNAPYISEWRTDGVILSFETNLACDVTVNYGLSENYTDQIQMSSESPQHQINLTDLQAATIYHYQIICQMGGDLIQTSDDFFVTGSPAEATGEVQVYFNGSVDTDVSEMVEAKGEENLYDRLIERIQTAEHSIDACFMKLTDWDVRDALMDAYSNGVAIRFICEQDEFDRAEIQALVDAGIPVITDTYGENTGSGLMHHKFAIFDHHNTASFSDDWVWTGSFNLTYYGSYPQPYENVVAIQDPALCAIYTHGFEIMWGSDTETPDPQNARFGTDSFQNMPHQVMVGDMLAEVYFSPEGGGLEGIQDAILTADHTIEFCMFSFTRDYLANALIVCQQTADVTVQGLIDGDQIESDASYSQWVPLCNAFGEQVCQHRESKTLHHKYAVIDGHEPDSDPIVITGSYNWTNSAETRNNENVLILHSAEVADQYYQEFSKRYNQTSAIDEKSILPKNWQLGQNYPNPFNGITEIHFTVPKKSHINIRVFDIQGQTVRRLKNQNYMPGQYSVRWDSSNERGALVSSGLYFIRLEGDGFTDQRKMVLLR